MSTRRLSSARSPSSRSPASRRRCRPGSSRSPPSPSPTRWWCSAWSSCGAPAWCRSGRRCSTPSAPTRSRCSARYAGWRDALLMVADRRARRRHRRLPGRLPAGALPRDLLRHAEPGDVDDPLRRAGEDRDAGLDRRLPCRGRNVSRLPPGGRGAQSRALLAGARLLRARRLPGRALFPHRRRRAGGAGARQRDPASSFWASRSTG